MGRVSQKTTIHNGKIVQMSSCFVAEYFVMNVYIEYKSNQLVSSKKTKKSRRVIFFFIRQMFIIMVILFIS